ncbi:hypothetical protein [Streptomyces phytophilus]|uniref:hypothetical protein n=1 Tax=Streptomyces phytophilus TaxID=722715 RepID=UPI0015F06649|nr:hypothetical protein [Streptomyces phytophilus]
MTAALVITVWFFAPLLGAAFLIAACRAVDTRRGRPAARGHACQPHDHQPEKGA